MKLELRYPKIDGNTTEEQVKQIKKYLYQLVSELQIIIDNIPESVDGGKNEKNL